MQTMPTTQAPVIYSEVTYLEMVSDPKVSPVDLGEFRLVRVRDLAVSAYLEIYKAVGRDYLWNYRGGQSEAEIDRIINAPSTWLYLLYRGEECVGMAELDAANSKDIELVHFGLVPKLIDQGIGRKFLQNVIHAVWTTGVERMWLSTCGMDHPKAISFYESAGFKRFKTSTGEFRDWRFTGFYDLCDAPQIPHGKSGGS